LRGVKQTAASGFVERLDTVFRQVSNVRHGIVAAILASLRLQSTDDLLGDPRESPDG